LKINIFYHQQFKLQWVTYYLIIKIADLNKFVTFLD
jgi:hypothetical protein